MADVTVSAAVDGFMTAADAAACRTAIGAAALASPTFTGTPAAPTAAPGTNTTQVATTAFVTAAVTASTYIDGEVDTHADLPITVGTPALDSAYLVRDGSGLWLLTRKPAGVYIRTGNAGALADWTYGGEFADIFNDANFAIYDNGDSSKLVAFQCSGITTGTTRTLTVPDASGTLLLSGGALGTPSSGTATNITGLPISTGVSGLGANVATFLATASSANLAAAVTDETGTGALVFANTPTLVTPILGTPTSGTLTNCTGLPPAGLTTAAKTKSIGIVIDGGGSAITTGVKGDVSVPFACTITGARLLSNESGSIVIDIWKDTYANYPPTVADTITAAAKPTLSTATKSDDTTLTGWTTSISAGDTLRFNVDSITTCTRVVLQLTVTLT